MQPPSEDPWEQLRNRILGFGQGGGLKSHYPQLQARTQDLSRSIDRFAMAFHASPALLALTRIRDGHIFEINQAFLDALGFTREEVVGRTTLELGVWPTPLDRDQMLATIQATGGARHLDVQFRRKDGSPLEVLCSVAPLEFGEEPGLLVMSIDVSARREAEREKARLEQSLAQAQKMEALGQLAGGIAHDFNNLLTAILLQGDMAKDLMLDAGLPLAPLEEIQQAAHRAKDLTRQLLAFSRRQVLQPLVLDLNETVRESERLLGRVLGEGVRMSLDLADSPLPVRADPGQLTQVILNLALNGRDAMPQGGELRIRSRMAEGQALLEVSDDGVGMSPEVQAHIFEPFFTTKPAGKGTGLGLSTVYGIICQSGGRIEVDSTPGRGTTFRIHLPLTDAAVSAAPEPPRPGFRSGRETILLVEDEAAVREPILQALQHWGHPVLDADSLAAAWAWIQRGHKPDILLTDVRLGDGMGTELARELQARWPDLRVLTMSGHADETLVQAGIQDIKGLFLAKPFELQDLNQALHQLLEQPPQGLS